MASIAYIATCVSRQLLIHSQKMELTKFEIRVLQKHYWKQDYKGTAEARTICEVEGEGVVSECVAQRWVQHFKLEKKTLKIYHVQEGLNYGIFRIYAKFCKKIRKKVLVDCQKTWCIKRYHTSPD